MHPRGWRTSCARLRHRLETDFATSLQLPPAVELGTIRANNRFSLCLVSAQYFKHGFICAPNSKQSHQSAFQRGFVFEHRRGWWKEIAYCHAEDFSKNCNSLVSDGGTPRFNIGEDVACHVAPKQLYFGGEHVLCPTGSMPKFDHVLSNDVCIFEHTFQKIRVAKNLF